MNAVTTTIAYSSSCRYCAATHAHTVERCANVREVRYRKDGTIKAVVKMSPADLTPSVQPSQGGIYPNWVGGIPNGSGTYTYSINGGPGGGGGAQPDKAA